MADIQSTPISLVSMIKESKLVGFTTEEAPSYNDMTRCIHCGLCLNVCPTYRETGNETESPRGRLYLMRAFAEGKIDAQSEALNEHLDLCLQCRACETACPSGVKYGHLIELTTAELAHQNNQKQGKVEKALRWVVFRQLFPNPKNLRMFALATRVYQTTPLQKFTRSSKLLHNPIFKKLGMGNLAMLEETMLPEISKPLFSPPTDEKVPAIGQQKYRVALFSGCIMSMAFAKVNEATVRVLARNGCEVVIPESMNCCGALNVHNGDRDYGKEMARRNIEVFEEAERKHGKLDAIIINAGGCGAMLKEYGDLLQYDKEYAERALAFEHKVQDITEFLGGIELNSKMGRVNKRVTMQESCHLTHGQKIKNQPRALLKAIPGLEYVEMRDCDKCCGSAGIYNVTHNEMSMQILDHKMENVAKTEAGYIVTTNPGCQIQMQLGVKRAGLGTRSKEVEVVHLVELLDEAYLAAEK